MPQLGAGRSSLGGVGRQAALSDDGDDAEAVALKAAEAEEEAAAPEGGAEAGSGAAPVVPPAPTPSAEEKPAPQAPATVDANESEELALDALILQTLFGETADSGAGGDDDIEEAD